jgi:hypothetical protein
MYKGQLNVKMILQSGYIFPVNFSNHFNGIRTKKRPVWITPGAAPLHWMGPNRNPRWEQKRTEGYVIVSTNDHLAVPHEILL